MCDETVDRVLHDLKVISAIRENDKVFTENGMLNLDHGHFTSPFTRWVRGECRIKGLCAIGNVLSDAFAISENNFRKMENKEVISKTREATVYRMKSYLLVCKIRAGVSDCLIGLKNLRSTYIKDTSITAKIDVIKESVTQGLRELDTSINIISDDFDITPEDIEPRYGEFLDKFIINSHIT
tara:strand:+ start:6222 stop:6767 length:546 start_codon:yes stop_codon:yes gene_type:complete